MNDFDKLNLGFFYDCPEDNCVKELYYNRQEQTYCVAIYLYSKIIDVHNISITDEEFVSRLKMYPDETLEFVKGTETFLRIQEMLNENEIIPDCVGMIRHILYSFATANLCDRRCKHCLHYGQCEAIKMHDNMPDDTDMAKDCGLFLDLNSMKSEKTTKILRIYFANEISKLSNFDQFVTYCNNCNISRDLLRSLNINYIVFSSSKSYGNHSGHAQVYATEEKAKEYVDNLFKSKMLEAARVCNVDTVEVTKENSSIIIRYKTNLGIEKSKIQLTTI